jgi:hypothetical protein
VEIKILWAVSSLIKQLRHTSESQTNQLAQGQNAL